MDTAQVTVLFALLATLCQLGAFGWLLLTINRLRPSVEAARNRVASALGQWALWAAAAVASVASAGSLYLSEVAEFPPCRLCWFQRIAMYPLAVVLTIAAVRRDTGIRIYATALAGLGAAVSLYHLMVERWPSMEGASCDPTNPCSIKWVEEWGYLTIPGMALSGFVAIIALMSISAAWNSDAVG